MKYVFYSDACPAPYEDEGTSSSSVGLLAGKSPSGLIFLLLTGEWLLLLFLLLFWPFQEIYTYFRRQKESLRQANAEAGPLAVGKLEIDETTLVCHVQVETAYVPFTYSRADIARASVVFSRSPAYVEFLTVGGLRYRYEVAPDDRPHVKQALRNFGAAF